MIDQVLAMLNNLTKDELEQVVSAAKGLKQFAAPGAPGSPQAAGSGRRGTDPYDFILDVLADTCRRKGVSMAPIEAYKRSRLYTKGFREPIVAVHAHMETFASGRLLQRAVYRLAYTHMIDRYRWWPPRMLASTTAIPRLLDEMLPGYQQAGLMPLVIERMFRHGTSDSRPTDE